MRNASIIAIVAASILPSIAAAQQPGPAASAQPEAAPASSTQAPAPTPSAAGRPASGEADTSTDTDSQPPAPEDPTEPATGSSSAETPPSEGTPAPRPSQPKQGTGARTSAEAGSAASATLGAGKAQPGPVKGNTPKPPPLASHIPEVQKPTFAEDWWTQSRPIVELHGYFRTRASLFHQFSLGRVDIPSQSIWAPPPDYRYGDGIGPSLCTGSETDRTSVDSNNPSTLYSCDNRTQSGANMRLRFNPEIHISDNLRVRGQIDLLDNLVLGSTPDGYRFASGADGLQVVPRTGYNQLGFYDTTQLPPNSSSNNFTDSVHVKRAWGEYSTPFGELRFGRMPNHWGMGMLYNSGDTYDADYQSTVDRLMFMTTFRSWDLTVGAAWDFVNEGAIGSINIPGAQPYDRAALDDVNEYALIVLRQKSPELEKLALSRDNLVLNAGFYFVYRSQTLANDQAISGAAGGAVPGANLDRQPDAYARRGAEAFVPDLWLQLKYKKFRFEAEMASIIGSIGDDSIGPNSQASFQNNSGYNLRQYGLATELEQKLVENKLRLKFNFGWASGDPDAYDPSVPGDLIPGPNETQVNDHTISTFRFNPAYRVDLILNRNILQRIQGTYYFRPSVEYDFIRDERGQRAGGGVQAIWTRATEFVQTPGHQADLGLELDGTVYYQSRDGGLNDTPDTMGGFYSALQYGVLFPFQGMGYPAAQAASLPGGGKVKTAQILRLYLGIMF